MLKRQAITAVETNKNEEALSLFEKLHQLESQALRIPPALLFVEADLATKAGNYLRARSALKFYFETPEKSGSRYEQAIRMWARVEPRARDAEERERQREQQRAADTKYSERFVKMAKEATQDARLSTVLSQAEQLFRELPEQHALRPRVEALISTVGVRFAEVSREAASRLVSTLSMVSIPAGTFQMGDNTGKHDFALPIRTVRVSGFSMQSHEITNQQWAVYCSTNADLPACGTRLDPDGRMPIRIEFQSVERFVLWLNEHSGGRFRLPSEAEWEYAARGGSKNSFAWGRRPDPKRMNADWVKCSGNTLENLHCTYADNFGTDAPVGSFPANAYRLYDMHGNSPEWVADCWHPSYVNAPAGSEAWISGCAGNFRITRGSNEIAGRRNLNGTGGFEAWWRSKTGVSPEPNGSAILIEAGFRLIQFQ